MKYGVLILSVICILLYANDEIERYIPCLPATNYHPNTLGECISEFPIPSLFSTPIIQNIYSDNALKPKSKIQAHSSSSTRIPDDSPLESYGTTDVYAYLIRQSGNDDDPNDIAPDILVRMCKKNKGILKGRSLVVHRGDTVKLYAHDTPLGGRTLKAEEQVKDAVYIHLDEGEKGDSMYQKIIAATQGIDQVAVNDTKISELREQIANFVSRHPTLAKDANQALEDDPFYTVPVDKAIEIYNRTPHPNDPVYKHRPTRPWLYPLIRLLTRMQSVSHNAIMGKPLFGPLPDKKVTATALRNNSVEESFRHFINDHKNLDQVITKLDRALHTAETETHVVYEGRELSRQLKKIHESGKILSEKGSNIVLKYFNKLHEINFENSNFSQANKHRYSKSDIITESIPKASQYVLESSSDEDSFGHTDKGIGNSDGSIDPVYDSYNTALPGTIETRRLNKNETIEINSTFHQDLLPDQKDNQIIEQKPDKTGQNSLFSNLKQNLSTIWQLLSDPLTFPGADASPESDHQNIGNSNVSEFSAHNLDITTPIQVIKNLNSHKTETKKVKPRVSSHGLCPCFTSESIPNHDCIATHHNCLKLNKRYLRSCGLDKEAGYINILSLSDTRKRKLKKCIKKCNEYICKRRAEIRCDLKFLPANKCEAIEAYIDCSGKFGCLYKKTRNHHCIAGNLGCESFDKLSEDCGVGFDYFASSIIDSMTIYNEELLKKCIKACSKRKNNIKRLYKKCDDKQKQMKCKVTKNRFRYDEYNTQNLLKSSRAIEYVNGIYTPTDNFLNKPFIINKINELAESIIAYPYNFDTLFETIALRLSRSSGTNVYRREQIDGYIAQYKELCENQKKTVSLLSQSELNDYSDILELQDVKKKRFDKAGAWVKSILQQKEPPYLHQIESLRTSPIHTWIPYSYSQILSGALSSYDEKQILLDTPLEKLRYLFTHNNYVKIMNDSYKADKVGDIRDPILESLNIVMFPEFMANKVLNEIKSSTGVNTNIDLETVLGTYARKWRYPPHQMPADKDTWLEEKMNYTALDIFYNTGQAKHAREARRAFSILPEYSNDSRIISMINYLFWDTDIAEKSRIYFDLLSKDIKFTASLQKLMKKNREFYYSQQFSSVDEHDILSGSYRHPFITLNYKHHEEIHHPKPGEELYLFSYITGLNFKVKNRVVLENEIKNKKSDLFKWLIYNGGLPFANRLYSDKLTVIPCHKPKKTAGISSRFEETLINHDYGNINFKNMREEYISKAPNDALTGALSYVKSQHKSYKEMSRAVLFEMIRAIFGIIGFIPVAGDIIDLLGVYLISEIEIAMEENYLLKKDLIARQPVELGIAASLTFIPYVYLPAGKRILKAFRKSIKNFKTPKKSLLSSIEDTFPDAPKHRVASKNKKIKIERDSFDWHLKCLKSRVKRGGGLKPLCQTINIMPATSQLELDGMHDWTRARPGQLFYGAVDTVQKKAIIVPVGLFNKDGLYDSVLRNMSPRNLRRRLNFFMQHELARETERLESIAPTYMEVLADKKYVINPHELIVRKANFNQDSSLGFILIKENDHLGEFIGESVLNINDLSSRHIGSSFNFPGSYIMSDDWRIALKKRLDIALHTRIEVYSPEVFNP